MISMGLRGWCHGSRNHPRDDEIVTESGTFVQLTAVASGGDVRRGAASRSSPEPASGIGAALARRLAAGGARVVVNDLDAAGAHEVAASVGGFAAPGDAAADEGCAALVRAAREAFGGVDLFCANAGVGVGGGPEAPDHDWELAWQVNVMAHVHAARHVLPEWLERGRGHFVATVSAAGLLTMPGPPRTR